MRVNAENGVRNKERQALAGAQGTDKRIDEGKGNLGECRECDVKIIAHPCRGLEALPAAPPLTEWSGWRSRGEDINVEFRSCDSNSVTGELEITLLARPD